MNMKFKVGDKVTIRKDLSDDEYNVVSDMEHYRGMVATITEVKSFSYLIDLDDRCWYWDDSMFEESKEEKRER